MMRLNKTAATRLLLRRTGYQICCLSDDETYNAVQYSSMLLDYSMSHESHVCTFKIERDRVQGNRYLSARRAGSSKEIHTREERDTKKRKTRRKLRNTAIYSLSVSNREARSESQV